MENPAQRRVLCFLLAVFALINTVGCVSYHSMPNNLKNCRKRALNDRERLDLRSNSRIAVVAEYPYEKLTITTYSGGYYNPPTSAGVSAIKPSLSFQTAHWLAQVLREKNINADAVKVITSLPEVIYNWAVEARAMKARGVNFDAAFPQEASRSMAKLLILTADGKTPSLDDMNEALRRSMRQLFDEIEPDTRLVKDYHGGNAVPDYDAALIPRMSDWDLKTRFAMLHVLSLFILPLSENYSFCYNIAIYSNQSGNSSYYTFKYGYTNVSSLLLLPAAPFFQHNADAFVEDVDQRLQKDIPGLVKAVMKQ